MQRCLFVSGSGDVCFSQGVLCDFRRTVQCFHSLLLVRCTNRSLNTFTTADEQRTYSLQSLRQEKSQHVAV